MTLASFQQRNRIYRTRARAVWNIARGHPTVYGVALERPPALVVSGSQSNVLVCGVVIDGGKGANVEVRP